MPRYAMVNDEKQFVANVILWSGNEADWIPPAGHTMMLVDDVPCAPGWTVESGNFIAPPSGEVPVPAEPQAAEPQGSEFTGTPPS